MTKNTPMDVANVASSKFMEIAIDETGSMHFHRALHPVTFLWSSETRRIVMSVTATYTLA